MVHFVFSKERGMTIMEEMPWMMEEQRGYDPVKVQLQFYEVYVTPHRLC
jgi:hypothetical protein